MKRINNNGTGDSADEVLAKSWSDGAGRVRLSRTPHSFDAEGDTVTWAGTLVEYDILGRVRRQSLPTEVDGVWDAAGDDAVRGFLWTHQKYDWMGRVVRKINTDGEDSAVLNDSDILISYEGCGCAGGLVTTVQGESVPRDDQPTQNARRTQKVYEDILGRAWKTVVFKWDGTTPYTTTEQAFNGRDQVIRTRQTDNTSAANPQAFQDHTFEFDGHGRAWKTHRPEQRDASDNPTYTIFNYNPDDGVASVTDGRGVVTNFAYNSTGLLTGKTHSVPAGSGIPAAAGVVFGYDNLGNRTSMTDGLGVVNYEYDELSRMTAETRSFADALPDAPAGGSFRLEYEYDLGGRLRSYSDPYGAEIDYSHDRAGRISSVSGSQFAGVTQYSQNHDYRAWGALQHFERSSANTQSTMTYDNRLRVASFVANSITNPASRTFDKNYTYYKDGRLKLVDNTGGDRFDRFFSYDHQGRIKFAKSGIEAHGLTETNLSDLPYRQEYDHDAFGNIVSRESTRWTSLIQWNFTYTVTNNRIDGTYPDADGRARRDHHGSGFGYDGAGLLVWTGRTAEFETVFRHDGLGRETKRSHRTWNTESEDWKEWRENYFIHSSVLGRIVSETTKTGAKKLTNVIAGGLTVARQNIGLQMEESLGWPVEDASGLSSRGGGENTELDALGNDVGLLVAPERSERGYSSESPDEGVLFNDFVWADCDGGSGYLASCMNNMTYGNPLPIEPLSRMDLRTMTNRNSPVYINRDILASTGSLYTDITGYGQPWDQRRREWETGTIYDSPHFDHLIGYSQVRDSRAVDSLEDQKLGRAYRESMTMLHFSEACQDYIIDNAKTSDLGVNADPERILRNRFKGSDPSGNVIRRSSEYTISLNGIQAAAVTVQYRNRDGKITKVGDTSIGRIFFDDEALAKAFKMPAHIARAYILLHELKHALGGVHNSAKEDAEWAYNINEKCLSMYK